MDGFFSTIQTTPNKKNHGFLAILRFGDLFGIVCDSWPEIKGWKGDLLGDRSLGPSHKIRPAACRSNPCCPWSWNTRKKLSLESTPSTFNTGNQHQKLWQKVSDFFWAFQKMDENYKLSSSPEKPTEKPTEMRRFAYLELFVCLAVFWPPTKRLGQPPSLVPWYNPTAGPLMAVVSSKSWRGVPTRVAGNHPIVCIYGCKYCK